MQDEAEKITPLAGRAALGKKEAATSAIFVVILLNMVVLVLVRAAGLLIPPEYVAVFWIIFALLIIADAALSPLCFHYAMKEVKENNAAPAYTIAMKGNGTLYLFHRDGRVETLNAGDVIEIRAQVSRFGWNALAEGSARGYGAIKFVVQSKMGRIVKYKVKYVINCVRTAEFLREYIIAKGGGK
ncbi:MAG: hypothetical protein LUD27_06725 [Clostridia bacterium]|nr:hypothetical protein [Clostridia bacterium]